MNTILKVDRYIISLSLLFLLLGVLPFIILGFYNAPLADDYVYAHDAIDKGFLQSQTYWYFHWTGRYFATLLISANSFYWNWFTGSALIPIASIIAFCLSFYFFVKSFTALKPLSTLVLSALFIILYFSNLHTISQAFYWLPGLSTYLIGIILFLFIWGYFIRIYNGVYKIAPYSYLIAFIGIAMLMGTSELMIFYNNYISLLVAAYCYFNKKSKFFFASFMLLTSVGLGLFSILAPGNFVRHNYISTQAVDHFLQLKISLDVFFTQLLPKYIFNIPFILEMLFVAVFVSRQKFNHPIANKPKLKPLYFSAFLFTGFIVSYVPLILAAASEERAFNFNYFTFLLAATSSVIYASYYYNLSENTFIVSLKNNAVRMLFFLLLVVLIIFPKNNILVAYSDVFSDKPQCYLNELTARHNYLHSQEGKKFVPIKPLSCQPKSLFFVDVSPDAKSWKNDGYKNYFHIDTVVAAETIHL